MWNHIEKCWVPNCPNSRDRGYTKNFFPLPTSARYKETWLSLAGKKSSGLEELIYFCQDHFDPNAIETYMDKFVCLNATATPYFNMPERICRTCMSIIMDGDIFSVLSAKVPCTIPIDIKSELLTCRPEPLLQILNFCIPELNLQHDPLPLACFKCYHNIWLFYIFKLTCNAVEKGNMGNMAPTFYGKMVVCRSCPTTSGANLFLLKEDSPLGKTLKKMFLTNHPVEVVPLKVCLKCWNTLYKLEKFYQQCLTVEQKMQRQLAFNQFVVNSHPSSCNVVGSQAPSSHLRDFRKASHSYLSTGQRPPETSTGGESNTTEVKPDTSIPSTSVIRYSGKEESSHSSKPVGNALNGNLKLKFKNVFIDKFEEANAQAVNNEPSTSTNVAIKPDISDDDMDVETKEKDPSTKQRLAPTEKIALAGLMLKHGAPLKADLSPKIHFEAWVNIVREFHELGYERPLEVIQKTWKAMKKKAESVSQLIGPATHVNRLVMDYLRADRCNSEPHNGVISEANKKDNGEIICIDDEVSGDEKPVAVTSTVQTEKDRRPVGRPPGPRQASKKVKELSKTQKKKLRQEKIKNTLKQKKIARDCWDENRKLELVRKMRQEYDARLKNCELTSGRSPWKSILEHLNKAEYQYCTPEKLRAVWAKMKMSATIHLKDGSDLVDEEVWDMLQMQNAIQKSLVNKEMGVKGDNSEKKEAEVQKNDATNSNFKEAKTNDSDWQPLKKKVKNHHRSDPSSTLETKALEENRSTPLSEIPEITDSDATVSSTDAKPSTKRNAIRNWPESEKLRLVKLIKSEFTAMLKKREIVRNRPPWRQITHRIAESGFEASPDTVYNTWNCIKRTAIQNETKKQMSFLDQKVLRLLKLYYRSAAAKPTDQKKKPKVSDAEAKKEETKKAKDQSESDKECTRRITAQEKLDIISVVTSYGGEVFKVMKGACRGTFWPKVLANLNAKGYKGDMARMRSCWNNSLTSAKQAWADQKEANEFDKIIIEFMTEVIQEKNKNKEDDKMEDEAHKEEEDDKAVKEKEDDKGCSEEENGEDCKEEKDDSFDEITERLSTASNKSPPAGDDDKSSDMNYHYVSLEDIEKGYGVDNVAQENNGGAVVKSEPPLEELPFKIESYTSVQVIDILDSDEEN